MKAIKFLFRHSACLSSERSKDPKRASSEPKEILIGQNICQFHSRHNRSVTFLTDAALLWHFLVFVTNLDINEKCHPKRDKLDILISTKNTALIEHLWKSDLTQGIKMILRSNFLGIIRRRLKEISSCKLIPPFLGGDQKKLRVVGLIMVILFGQTWS